MNNVEIVEVEHQITGELIEYVVITNDNGSKTSMPKSVYDAQMEAAKLSQNVAQ